MLVILQAAKQDVISTSPCRRTDTVSGALHGAGPRIKNKKIQDGATQIKQRIKSNTFEILPFLCQGRSINVLLFYIGSGRGSRAQ